MKKVEDKFLKIVNKILKTKKNILKIKFVKMSDWDSLRNLQLLIQLEKEFKIKFNQKELVNFNSLESILKILIKKLMIKIKNIKDLIETFRNEKKIALVYNGKKISYENLYNDIISFSYEISTKSKKRF